MKKSEQLQALRSVPLFGGLSDRELRSVARHVREQRFSAGEQIIVDGTSGGPFFIVTEGEARVLVNGRRRRTVRAGEFFGEMSLLDLQPRAATVEAQSKLTVLMMPSYDFYSVLQDNWSVTQKILADLALRIRKADREDA
jgi:CRP-like cAMP-binding protein